MKNGLLRRIPGRFPGILALLASFFVSLFPLTARSQTIGIYTDENRSSCSLSDAGPGLIRAYVVVNVSSGMTGVRFAAPKPACFQATWMSDEIPDGFVSIGDSQTDISIAFGVCTPGVTNVLTIVYQKTSSTAPCCELPIVAPEGQSEVQYADCAFAEHTLNTTSGYVNANASCPCGAGIDQPPTAPSNPFPANEAQQLPYLLTLSWVSNDPEGYPLHFNVYFGTNPSPPLLQSGVTAPTLDVGPLIFDTPYYWKVQAIDPANNTTDGPVWSFYTDIDRGVSPMPVNPAPANGASNQVREVTLRWSLPAGAPVVDGYDVHFGTTPTPPLVASLPAIQRFFIADSLALDTKYYWNIVVKGPGPKITVGDVWSFHTVTVNPPPFAPYNPVPADNASNVALSTTLHWAAGDPESQPLEYDVYVGNVPNPPFKAHTTVPQLPVSFTTFEQFFWRVVVIDSEGASTSGPTWTYSTGSNQAPSIPLLVNPANGSTASPDGGVVLAWFATDPQNQALNYDVYIDTTPSPAFFQNTSESQLNYAAASNTKYYWKVVARDTDGNTRISPVWDFTTNDNHAPQAPVNPTPADLATDVNRTPTLTWEGSDSDGDSLTYRVYFGTSSNPPSAATVAVPQWSPPGALLAGTNYYWKIVARDPQLEMTPGPVWRFTTHTSNLPPVAPSNPDPPDAGTSLTLVTLRWEASDPEGFPLNYDVHFGTTPSPPLVVNTVENSWSISNLLQSTTYYWRIVAHDVDGNATTGPLWRFHTRDILTTNPTLGIYADASGTSCALSDVGAGQRNVYVIVDGPETYTGCRFWAPKPPCFHATWLYDSTPYLTIGDSQTDVSIGFGQCEPGPLVVMTIAYMSSGDTPGCCHFPLLAPPVIGNLLVTNCSFGEIVPENQPVLGISSDGSCPPCALEGFLRVAETADTCRTQTPHTMTVDLDMSPSSAGVNDGGIHVHYSPSLTFVSCERGPLTQNWTTFDSQETGGVVSITAVADPGYDPKSSGVFARLTFTTDCCTWSTPAKVSLSDPAGDFIALNLFDRQLTCVYPPDGDVNADGQVTVADAQCALETYLYAPALPPDGCAGPGAAQRADVDCSSAPTPADAYCIFRHWLDQSCSFCSGGASTALRTAGPAPRLSLRALRENDDVVVVLQVSGVPSVGALGFEIKYPDNFELVRIEPSRKDIFAALQTRIVTPGRVRVGAYANGAPVPIGDGDMLAIRLHGNASPGEHRVSLDKFVDDLGGAETVSISLDEAAAPVPSQVVLHQNSPNPFNPETSIRFELPQAMRVRLAIYDVHGRLVRQLLDEHRDAGASNVEWNGTDDRGATVATGVYFYVLDAGGKRYQHKMVLLK